MAYAPNIPQPTDKLSDSQGVLLSNFQQLDTSFGTDHYAFSNGTSNNGFHNTITTPLVVGSAHPATAAAIPKFYAMQDSANLGVIQYSRGPSNAVPSPVTIYQSPASAINIAPLGTTNVFDFTNLARAFAMLYASDTTTSTAVGICFIVWTGSALFLTPLVQGSGIVGLQFLTNGNIVQIKNRSNVTTLSNFYWSLQFLRTS